MSKAKRPNVVRGTSHTLGGCNSCQGRDSYIYEIRTASGTFLRLCGPCIKSVASSIMAS